jgi:hypothetical protein
MATPRTWKCNSLNPGEPFLSLLDRIMKDYVFKLDLIRTVFGQRHMPILPELVEQALDQKARNRRYGHISFPDRRDYYVRRAARFKARVGASDDAHSRERDAPALTDARNVKCR